MAAPHRPAIISDWRRKAILYFVNARSLPMPFRPVVFANAILIAAPAVTLAQTTGYDKERPHVHALRTDQASILYGEVVHDAAYALSEPVTQFWQTTPNSGAAASERTKVRIVYTNHALHIGVTCFGDEPDAIIVSDNRRDAPLDDTDSFTMIFDTYVLARKRDD